MFPQVDPTYVKWIYILCEKCKKDGAKSRYPMDYGAYLISYLINPDNM